MDKAKIYIKKPVKIEAIQWLDNNQREYIEEWSNRQCLVDKNAIKIYTLDGMMTAHKGDWIVKDSEGEFYSYRNEVFKKLHVELE